MFGRAFEGLGFEAEALGGLRLVHCSDSSTWAPLIC